MVPTGLRRLALIAVLLAACGDNEDSASGLDAYLPEIPEPTGEPQSVYAGVIDESNAGSELLPGSAARGMPGDFYIRSSRGRFIIQAPARVIGVIPQGGNLVDALPIGDDGPAGEDHFGELSSIYVLGRTCEHESIEVVQDGSGGGVAAIVARGKSGVNDFINLKGIGLITVPANLDPDIPDAIECATTYILHPDSPQLEVYWTFYNAGDAAVRGPFGTLTDTGGDVASWGHGRGFERLGIESLTDPNTEAAPVEYVLFQGPDVAYGLVPQLPEPDLTNTTALIQGVSVVLYGADELFDFITPEGAYFDLPGKDGVTHAMRVVVGRDAADIEEQVRLITGEETHQVSGTVTWSSGEPAAGARVGLFRDDDGDGEIGPDDTVWSYADADADGRFEATLAAGSYLARADVLAKGRSASVAVDLTADREVDLEVPAPVYYDYTVVDDASGDMIPARLVVVGQTPAPTDQRLFSTYDTFGPVADVILATRGTSVDVGDGADRRIALVPGASYRVLASRGTEWSVASYTLSPQAGDPDGELEFRLRRVVDTTGYIASEYHVHAIGSPDSPVDWPDRIASAAADGIELFAATEHDYVADYQHQVEELGLERLVHVIPGVETTPFAFGHFNAWPIERDAGDPSGGAIDWARGADGFGLLPAEIFEQMRGRGAELVQVNHPRSPPTDLTDFMQYFDRAGLRFDYEERTITGDLLGQPVPNEWLRLPPDQSMWSLAFNALEVWNSLGMADSDGDGRREPQGLDVVMRDWFNFLSFGVPMAPLANSDTHTVVRDPLGMPRTLVRVDDDSPEALADGSVVGPLIDTLAGRGSTAYDVVLTNGPHIRVTQQGEVGSVIGKVIEASGGEVTLTIEVEAPMWAEFDTIEVFANATPELGADVTSLPPVACFTPVAQDDLDPADPCASAPLGATVLDVSPVEVAPGFDRWEATVNVTLSAAELIYPEGATGQDAWVVVRARGNRAIYPLLLSGAITAGNLETLVSGSDDEVRAALEGIGISATAFTAPVFLDLDGGGYRAPFAPE